MRYTNTTERKNEARIPYHAPWRAAGAPRHQRRSVGGAFFLMCLTLFLAYLAGSKAAVVFLLMGPFVSLVLSSYWDRQALASRERYEAKEKHLSRPKKMALTPDNFKSQLLLEAERDPYLSALLRDDHSHSTPKGSS